MSKLFGKEVRIKNSDRSYRFLEFAPGNHERCDVFAAVLDESGKVHICSADQLSFNINEILDEDF